MRCPAKPAAFLWVLAASGLCSLPLAARETPPASGLRLSRPVRPGAFFDVVGRRSAAFGYEGKSFEAWAWPLQLVDDFRLAFRLEGYPLDFEGADLAASIDVRPEATTLTYSHAAFTVRQTIFAPLDEPALVVLLDVQSALPLTVVGSFRPRLKLMWPAGLMTGNLEWDRRRSLYFVTEESKRYAAVLGAPGLRDAAAMPYQEEPRDVPARFLVDVPPGSEARTPLAIVLAGSLEGKDGAQAVYDRVSGSLPALYERNVAWYRELEERTLQLATPDARLDAAYAWAKVGVDKGFATSPLLGTGLLAGFRTAGQSERPGFAWFFGRDALWTALALTSYGDFAGARSALDFLRRHQRADGKIPHEVSQSASLVPWFEGYEYAWKSADATPLYVIAQADLWRASGDLEYLKAAWDGLLKAYRFSAATDSDGNGLIENTGVGHGWVEGGGLYPAHEELYLQGLWVQACRDLAELAEVLHDEPLAAEARARAAASLLAVERTYWLAPPRGFYAFATMRPPEKPRDAEPGPERERRQRRVTALEQASLVDESTVFPAVPLWWRLLDPAHAQAQIDRLGGAALATDWGQRLLEKTSELYDPLAYHDGSVWPLFTGWAAMAAYRQGRPHVGYQALLANALLTEPGALGYVTELLSGDFNAPFGRSSHHQVWSEAMVVTPLVRGLLGLEVRDGGRTLRFAPQLPADWDHVALRNVPAGEGRLDIGLQRRAGRLEITLTRRSGSSPLRVELAPALPLDARPRSVSAGGRALPFRAVPLGDRQSLETSLQLSGAPLRVTFAYDGGSDVAAQIEPPDAGARSEGLRILTSRAERDGLRLSLEGRAGSTYALELRSPRRPRGVPGLTIERQDASRYKLRLRFEGAGDGYVRRDMLVPLEP